LHLRESAWRNEYIFYGYSYTSSLVIPAQAEIQFMFSRIKRHNDIYPAIDGQADQQPVKYFPWPDDLAFPA
jgi:hypothetical protein